MSDPTPDPAPAVVAGSGVRVFHAGAEILGITDVTPPSPKTDATERRTCNHRKEGEDIPRRMDIAWEMKVKFHFDAATYAASSPSQLARHS